jgi:HEAT repeat protein
MDEGREQVVEQLIAALTDPEREVRLQAALALYRLHDRQAVPQLIAALASPDKYVRAVAAQALAELEDARAVQPFIELLQRGEYGDVRDNAGAAAAQGLGRLGDRRAVDALTGALAHPHVHQQAVEALARLGDMRAVEPLIAALRTTKNPSVATVLGNLHDRWAVEPLLAELQTIQLPRPASARDRRWQGIYFYYVVRALGKLGDLRALPLLEWVREHETAPVLKGRSIGEMAAKAIQHIQEQHEPDAHA